LKKLILRIEPGLENIRMDKALSQHPEIRTRSRATKLIERGLVTFNQIPVKASRPTQLGEAFEIEMPQQTSTKLEPLELALDVVFEDQDLIVINKPAGLVMHPAAGHEQDTLVNALLHHTQDLSMGFQENRPGIVHRLDKETSGLIVIAKNDETHHHLAEQFQARSIHRLYWAICYGNLKTKQATVETNLARHPRDRKKFASGRNGKVAITHYQVLQESVQGLSWLAVKLQTGRTHQIRVHLSEAGHPIVGDLIYGTARRVNSLKSGPLKKCIGELSRVALHATELGFIHPRTGEQKSFSAGWSTDLLELIELGGFS
jgi:23S rRNA pseudouridine1911/1915/1917 synthase